MTATTSPKKTPEGRRLVENKPPKAPKTSKKVAGMEIF